MKIDTAEKANELFEYRDGSLYWKIRPSPAANIGDKAGCVGNRGLVRVTYKRIGYMEARLVMLMHGVEAGKTVVHINGDQQDSRIENLRSVSDYATLNQNDLIDLFNYDAASGLLTYKTNTKNKSVGEVAGKENSDGYLQIKIGKRSYKVHRLIWFYVYGCWPVDLIDHINGNRTDNRICNLREATNAQNMRNSKLQRRNKSGEKGVMWRERDKRWIAACKVNGKPNYVGCFVELQDAVNAVREFRNKHHGEFARNN